MTHSGGHHFGVITALSIPEFPADEGNWCDDFAAKDKDGVPNVATVNLMALVDFSQRLTDGQIINVRLPVFELGEVLILNDYGREVCGKGRKPSKWAVVCEEFDNLDAAIARSLEVAESQKVPIKCANAEE